MIDAIFWWVGCVVCWCVVAMGAALTVGILSTAFAMSTSWAFSKLKNWKYYAAYHMAGCEAMRKSIRADQELERQREEARRPPTWDEVMWALEDERLEKEKEAKEAADDAD